METEVDDSDTDNDLSSCGFRGSLLATQRADLKL